MIVRSIDIDHDWTFGKGRNDYKSANDAIAQNVDTRLNSFIGDCFFALNAGIDWFNLLGSKNQVGLELAIRSVIINTALVTGIKSLSSAFDPITRRLTTTYTLTTIYTNLNAAATIVSTSTLLLTQDGDALTTEDGDGLSGG